MADRELTFGEKAVGINFNPGQFTPVDHIKERAAELIDTLNDYRNATDDGDQKRMFSLAINDIQSGQMWGVKAATWLLPAPAVTDKTEDNKAWPEDGMPTPFEEIDAEVSGVSEPLEEIETEDSAPLDKRVVRTKSSGDRVYMLDEVKMTRQWVTNPDVLKGLGFSPEDVKEIDDLDLLKYQMASAIYKVD